MRTLTFCLLIWIACPVQAQDEARKTHFNLEDDLGIQGYDPVAYFTENEAVKGKKDYQFSFKGIPYRFVSESNLNTFKSNPSMYEPAYGGWCAYAMGVTGDKVNVDPETFKIVDGRLNLFYNFFFNNTLKDWNKDEENLKSKAADNWSKIYNN